MPPTPETNPWEGLNGPGAGTALTTCPHCETRTWVRQTYVDPYTPTEECANCSTVWEGDEIIDDPDDA